ncbi:UNVERIFIED_CONTAM: hypothetical protein Scaly_0864000 [Sesamum calycinum]|uniref:Integrase catalytic domain-containing protein n=1 Tax=Sesamum calycinum TaxID=2727403 RepID=A0AAW2QW30_9LAMI
MTVIPPIFSDDEDDTFQEEENHVMQVYEIEEKDWQQTLVDYLKYEKLPNDLRRRTDTRRRATRFIYYKGTLYRRSFDRIFLRCLSNNEKVQAMKEAHSRVCGAHRSRPKLHFCIKRTDIVGPLTKFSGGHLYILAATDYFSKWAEAVPLKQKFLYYAAANGLAEVLNKTLCNLLKKVVPKLKHDWHERIGEALWAYRTTVRTPT